MAPMGALEIPGDAAANDSGGINVWGIYKEGNIFAGPYVHEHLGFYSKITCFN